MEHLLQTRFLLRYGDPGRFLRRGDIYTEGKVGASHTNGGGEDHLRQQAQHVGRS